MPIINPQDAREVDEKIDEIFDAGSTTDRLERIRQLFVGILDFDPTFNFSVGLSGARGDVKLPDEAHLVARLDDVQVVYVDMSESEIETDRVNKREAQEAARLIEAELGDELLLVFTNRNREQLHFVYPSFEGRQPSLRRMVVEKGLPRRTLVQQISNIWGNWRVSGDIRAELDAAFDVEAVTRLFFAEYKKVFDGAMERISGFGDDKEEFENKNLFVQTLFNRLMFVYFISRKGWLEFDGNYEYLDAVWSDHEENANQDNFYEARLMPLFFEGLNNPFNRNVTSIDPKLRALIGQVPFLNGGLFERTDLDRREGVVVPDDAVRPILTQLFDRFNFTVMESTPLDVEVAVDPEMLGKVFEELVTGRHESGSYYTPRPVVSFMCREALKGYLNARVGAASEAVIARFVDEHSTRGIKINAARQIAGALESVRVVDPACGSGAYLLGMMQELIDLQTTLFRVGVNSKELYELKLQIIRDNLYGVDNDEFAVNITMLRLWLSLAIDQTNTWPEPLPNLEFKIVCGDSLLGPDPSPENLGELSSHWVRDLDVVGLKSNYMYAHDPKEKMLLKARIDSAQEKFRETFADAVLADEAVDWRVDFAEVFVSGGFDVVVANPPYVESRSSSTQKASKVAYGRRFLTDWGVSLPKGSDLFIYFFARAAQLLSARGKAAFITQNGWLSSDYGKAFQDFTVGRISFSRIVDTNSRFFAQSGGPNINAVISFFDLSDASKVKYQMVDGGLTVQSTRSVFSRGNLKWGHLFAMPDWFQDMLVELSASENQSKGPVFKFGQGINVPKARLNVSGADIGVIAETPKFGCFEPDSHVLRSDLSEARLARAPALMMPRGIGRYYCSFNKCQAFSYSGVELYLPIEMWETDLHYCLWLYLNSSFAWLFREITGRTNLGGGMLKAEATDMKRFPSRFDFDFGDEAREVFADTSNEPPLAVDDELRTSHHRRIDEVIGKYFGINNRLDDIRGLLIERVEFRGTRARSV